MYAWYMRFSKVFGSISILWLGAISGAFFAFLTQVFLARELGIHDYGQFAAALATITIVAPLAGFGVSGFWLRIFGEEGWRAVRWVGPSLRFLILSTAVLIILILGWALIFEGRESSRDILILLSVYIFGQIAIELSISKKQLEGNYAQLSLWQVFPHLSRLIAVMITAKTLGADFSAIHVAFCYALLSILIAGFGGWQIKEMSQGNFLLLGHEKKNELSLIDCSPAIAEVFKKSFPYGAIGILYLVYFQSGVVFLGHIVGPEAVGVYNVAFTVLGAVYLFPSVVYQKFLMPLIQRWAYSDVAKSYSVYKMGSISMLVIGLIACGVVLILAPWFVKFAFGEQYLEAAEILIILSLCMPLRFVSSSSGAFLNAGAHVVSKIKIMLVAAVLNVFLNFVLIGLFNLRGAAFAMLITELFLLIACAGYVRLKVFNEIRKGLHVS